MDRYAVIGHPVAHSLSPRIHALFAQQTGERLTYDRIDPGPEGLEEAVTDFFATGGAGLNVTVPFKADAAALCAQLSERAQAAGVVNTLASAATGDGIRGDNTDGIGLVRDLVDNHGLVLRGARILLVGAGGAARGVLGPLLAAEPAAITIANRTAARAEELAAAFADFGSVQGCGFNMPDPGDGFDLVINASAASLGGAVPPIAGSVLGADSAAYDMMYGAAAEPFLDWARRNGAAVALDGLGMLVEQAAASFALWRGVDPATAPVLQTLRAA